LTQDEAIFESRRGLKAFLYADGFYSGMARPNVMEGGFPAMNRGVSQIRFSCIFSFVTVIPEFR